MWFVSGPVKKAMMLSSPKMNNPPPYSESPGNVCSRDLLIFYFLSFVIYLMLPVLHANMNVTCKTAYYILPEVYTC